MVAGRDDPGRHDASIEIVARALGTLAPISTSATAIFNTLQTLGIGAADLSRLADQGTLGDMVLVAACLAGDPRALRILDQDVQRACAESSARLRFDASANAETAQRLRARLLVGGPRTGPALATYDGRGPLLAWLRVSASRQALMLRRAEARHETEAVDTASAVEPFFDPELGVLKADSAVVVTEAFHAAFAEMSARDKMLLAYHYLDKQTLRQIGKILGVQASTVQRRLTRTRRALLAGTRAHFVAQCGVRGPELEQVLQLVRSQLDLSVSRLLRSQRASSEDPT